jgi:hypothetical protein
MDEFDDLKDITIRVTDTGGFPMTLVVPWDADLDAWEPILKTILTFLQFSVDEVAINPESDDPQGEEDKKDD